MIPDDTSPTTRPCCIGAKRVWCKGCKSFVCPCCDPCIERTPFLCRKCRASAVSDCCTCSATLFTCWSCDKRHCPECDGLPGAIAYQCKTCEKEDSALAGKQAPHDMGAVLEVARQENERLLAACKACVSAMTELIGRFAGENTSNARWIHLRVARNVALEAIAKAEGQPTATGSDGESGASTKQASPPSKPMVVDLLVEFQDKLAQVIADLCGQGPPTETPTQEPEA